MSDLVFENLYEPGDDYLANKFFGDDVKLTKDTIPLNPTQRKQFLELAEITESDKVFIYEFMKDSVTTLNVKDLPALACINIYAMGYDDEPNYESDYGFGLDIGKRDIQNDNLVYIGQTNPFQAGNMTSLIWDSIPRDQFPKLLTSLNLKKSSYTSYNEDG